MKMQDLSKAKAFTDTSILFLRDTKTRVSHFILKTLFSVCS